VNRQIRAYKPDDLDEIVQLSILAWEPVFVAWGRILGPELYPIAIYPDWRVGQADVVARICRDEKNVIAVSEVAGQVVGFVVYDLDHEKETGEVQLLAVHPDYQNDGIGTALNHWALAQMQAAGMKLAVVGTGGDEGHAPARRSYEKAGYTGLPLVRYYKKLR
jgi:ribosomal protein S18 acetylase RimI-like enzyme